MPERFATDAMILAVRQLMEMCREGQREFCIIEFEKAHDRVLRTEVWNGLRLKEIDRRCIRLIQNMYESSKANVKCMVGTAEGFQVKVGLYQPSSRLHSVSSSSTLS